MPEHPASVPMLSPPGLPDPVWHPCGDTGLLLDLGGYRPAYHDILCAVEDKSVLTLMARRLAGTINDKRKKGEIRGITDIVPGLASLLIHYDPLIIRAGQLKSAIYPLLSTLEGADSLPARLWHLPVCYAPEFAPDMAEISEQLSLSPEQIIELHLSVTHEVAIMGFLPGLGYMTGLPDPLHLPRRANPRTDVRQGSVGIAMDQTVIYPLDSPGGWNLIGRMPYLLCDPAQPDPIWLAAGDRVKFSAISADEFDAFERASISGSRPDFEMIEGAG